MNGQTRQQLERRWELKMQMRALEEEKEKLEKELFPLYIAMYNEQVDVNNLESRSIRNWFLEVTGKREAMLRRERMEAQNARLNHDMVSGKLEYTGQQLAHCREELAALCNPTDPDWIPEENRDLITRELQAALDTGETVLQKIAHMIQQINNLIEQNRWGMSKSVMPGYLAAAQKKINALKKQLFLFAEEASDLPVRDAVMSSQEQLLAIDDHLLDQTVGGIGTDGLLGECHSALVASQKRIKHIMQAIEQEILQLR